MDKKRLERVHRVRTLQLGFAQAAESQARDTMASEAALSNRIAQLAAAVAPVESSDAAFSLAAAAHYRDRLSTSAHTAENRVRAAERQADVAAEATREARRDQSAIEKLMMRADAEAALGAIRAMEDMPAFRKVRHDPC